MLKKYLFYKENNLLLINFDSILSDAEIKCLNDLEKYGLIEDYKINLSKKDTKKIIYHNIIYALCEEIKTNDNKQHKVIVIPPHIRDFHEISGYCNQIELENLLLGLIKRIKKYLPFLIHNADDFIFETFTHPGEIEEMVTIISELAREHEDKKFTFEKIKRFTNEYDLVFLSKEYFNSFKTVLLL